MTTLPSTASRSTDVLHVAGRDGLRSWAHRAWMLGLGWHVLAFAAVLLAIAVSIPLASSVSSDEGAYALQVEALQAGSWSLDYPFASIDPEDAAYPFVNVHITDNGYFPAPTTPLYVRLLEGSAAVFGRDVGLHVPSLAGAVVAAAAAWLVGAHVATRLARPAFWITAASPLIVNAPIVWAHALSAGCAGIAFYGALQLCRRGSGRAWLCFALGLAGAAAVRSDAVATVGALSVVTALVLARQRRLGASIGALAVCASVASVVLVQRRWVADLVGSNAFYANERRTRGLQLDDRLWGVYSGLVRGGWSDQRALLLGTIVGAVLAWTAWAVWRRGPDASRMFVLGSSLMAAVLIGRHMVAPRDYITGLLIAWPLLLVALAARRWSELQSQERFLLVVAGVASVGILALQHSSGAGIEWGGRYFSTLTVPLAVLAAGGILALLDRSQTVGGSGAPSRRMVAAGALVLAALPSVLGLRVTDNVRRHHDHMISSIEALEATVAITTEPALPRVAWRTVPEIAWLSVEESDVHALVQRVVATSSPSRIAIVGPEDPDPIAGYRREPAGYAVWLYERVD